MKPRIVEFQRPNTSTQETGILHQFVVVEDVIYALIEGEDGSILDPVIERCRFIDTVMLNDWTVWTRQAPAIMTSEYQLYQKLERACRGASIQRLEPEAAATIQFCLEILSEMKGGKKK